MKNDIRNRLRNLILYQFMSYHNGKIDADEFCKRFKRLDKFYRNEFKDDVERVH